ncbi:hypothetical protein PYCCODRAFT_1433320 [Trametes coccinea BRFM310]|uniref:F-box domain-containing protein n=1 Tax=Trametes coccinea (strain BRFM310) TaxID=1353009 RepID=A0A1Y2IWY3_TRAC3|nr:hypothetical protein PYCCODRAFT_1433320 [Trametes coccinea BRFM310]
MHSLPVEVLEPIFLLACTDGGQTGCALSLTSKYIRTASHRTRFHSVSLVSGSVTQVVRFVASYGSACEQDKDEKPRVRHLCLAAANRRISEDEDARPETRKKILQQYLRDVMVLIDMVAQDVETLCFINHCPKFQANDLLLPALIPAPHFPSLVELAVVGLRPVELQATDTSCMPPFPRLRTYHRVIIPNLSPTRTADTLRTHLLSQWKERGAPNASDIRIVLMSQRCRGRCIAMDRILKDSRIQWSFAPMLALYVQSTDCIQ